MICPHCRKGMIPINKVYWSADRYSDLTNHIECLKADLFANDQISPIKVIKQNGVYLGLDGLRRCRALLMLGETEVLAMEQNLMKRAKTNHQRINTKEKHPKEN